MTVPKYHNNLSGINTKDMEICDFLDKEFKMAILRKLNDLQENTERQFNKITETVYQQSEKINKEMLGHTHTHTHRELNRNSGAEIFTE